jgi:hypothetical protein
MKTIVLGLALALGLSSCRESEAVATEETTTTETAVTMEAPMQGATDLAAASAPVYSDQKIIKNANLRFETEDLEATAEIVGNAVKKYKAQVQNDTEGNRNYELNRNMTVRIPSQHFEAFIADISKGVKYFDIKEISSDDVTEAYIDTEARIKAKKVLEARYLELIGKAKKVSEILEIEKELSAIREEIEAKEGQLRYMKSRIAMSTITIEFYKRTAERREATVSYGSKMWNAVASGFNGLSSFFIGLLNVWPLILIFVIVFIIIRKKLKKRKQRS